MNLAHVHVFRSPSPGVARETGHPRGIYRCWVGLLRYCHVLIVSLSLSLSLLARMPARMLPCGQWLCPRCLKTKKGGKGKVPSEKAKTKKPSTPAAKSSGTAGGGVKGKTQSPSTESSSSTAGDADAGAATPTPAPASTAGGSSKKRGPSEDGDGAAKKRRRGAWTEAQEALLTEAVEKLGVGHWKQIVSEYDFDGKEGHMLKDKWRRMEAKRLQNGD